LCRTVVEVKNRGWQWVRLGTPHTDCGCFSARWDRQSLGPWQSAVLVLELRPPEVPGPFERQVLIGAGTHPSPFRKITVRGRATAEVWAVPSSVEVELDAQGEGVQRVQVFRRLPKPLARVEPDCPEIAVRCTSADEDALRTDMERSL
jgi:hypothetical protein